MTTDLLGHPIPDPPPMNAPLPWRVFRMSDISDETEWVLARTVSEAVAFYVEFCNELGDCRNEEQMRAQGSIHDVHELTDAELNEKTVDDPASPWPEGYTFTQALADATSHAKVPMFFSTTEY